MIDDIFIGRRLLERRENPLQGTLWWLLWLSFMKLLLLLRLEKMRFHVVPRWWMNVVGGNNGRRGRGEETGERERLFVYAGAAAAGWRRVDFHLKFDHADVGEGFGGISSGLLRAGGRSGGTFELEGTQIKKVRVQVQFNRIQIAENFIFHQEILHFGTFVACVCIYLCTKNCCEEGV